MQIAFSLNGVQVEFYRDQLTGRAELRMPNEVVSLQSPLNPATHFTLKLTKTWRQSIAGSEVVIEKVRPLLLAGLRPSKYRIFVDGQLAAEDEGV